MKAQIKKEDGERSHDARRAEGVARVPHNAEEIVGIVSSSNPARMMARSSLITAIYERTNRQQLLRVWRHAHLNQSASSGRGRPRTRRLRCLQHIDKMRVTYAFEREEFVTDPNAEFADS